MVRITRRGTRVAGVGGDGPRRRGVWRWWAWLTVAGGSVAMPAAAGAQDPASGGDATIYVGAYDRTVLVVDEATLEVTDRIPIASGIPVTLIPSHDRSRLYVVEARTETVEVVDLATRRSVDRFTLTEGDTRVRIRGLSVDPTERFAVFLIKTYTKLADRFVIGPPTLVRYDLARHVVSDTIPWPDGEEREFARILFSPDGDLMYFFSDDILVLDAETFDEVDRWAFSEALEPGMGRFNFGFPTQVYEEPGFHTGLFRVTDPVQNRSMMGVARVNLEARDVDFYMLGPSEGVSFAVAPDGRKAYGLRQEIGSYEFWTFDLEGRRLESRTAFRGRPRMALMPSSNGRLLYIYNAGNTIDVYEAATYRHLRTAELDADMTAFLLLPSGGGGDR